VTRVIIPASFTDIYTDMRILLGWAWTYLIVAEVVGTMSGITFFINQQARYRNFDNVYAAIMMIGIIGLTTDIALAWLGKALFPWKRATRAADPRRSLPSRPDTRQEAVEDTAPRRARAPSGGGTIALRRLRQFPEV
jgi:NitT/TauT family transport system permease protein